MKNKTLFLSFGLVLGVCLTAFSVAAQEIAVVDNVKEPTPVDFPGRSSLGEMKEAPLPSLSDSIIKEPTPMERVVSKKELPSEQLLGRITSEVFHEMADLERGNVFLKMQAQREQLKNELEALKAQYRETRLAEIEKRESVIRDRVKWQQEQEQIRQEFLEKKLKTELLEKQLEELEVEKEDLLPIDEDQPVVTVDTQAADTQAPAEEANATVTAASFDIQKIIDIKGMKGRLTARVIDGNDKKWTLKVGMTLPSGQTVKSIDKTDIVLEKNGKTQTYNIDELNAANAELEEEEEYEEVEDDAQEE